MAALPIRDARPDDLDVIVDFNARLALETEGKALDPEHPPPRRRDRAWPIPTGSATGSPRTRTGSVVGQAAITREWSDWRDGWIWWFQSVYVHPDSRGRGTFRALYAQIRRDRPSRRPTSSASGSTSRSTTTGPRPSIGRSA